MTTIEFGNGEFGKGTMAGGARSFANGGAAPVAGDRAASGRKASLRVLTDAMWDKVAGVVNRVDQVAQDMEVKWGVGRLPYLVDQPWTEKFLSQRRKFHSAVHEGSPADVEIEGQRMINAWTYLDGLASSAGRRPLTGPSGLQFPLVEGLLPDGTLMMVVSGHTEAHTLAKWRKEVGDTRKAQIWAVEEIMGLLKHAPSMQTLALAKEAFGEAVVESVRESPLEAMGSFINDEIPF